MFDLGDCICQWKSIFFFLSLSLFFPMCNLSWSSSKPRCTCHQKEPISGDWFKQANFCLWVGLVGSWESSWPHSSLPPVPVYRQGKLFEHCNTKPLRWVCPRPCCQLQAPSYSGVWSQLFVAGSDRQENLFGFLYPVCCSSIICQEGWCAK